MKEETDPGLEGHSAGLQVGGVELLVPVMDYDGMAMFHCHILEHEDIGMIGMWHIMKGGMPM